MQIHQLLSVMGLCLSQARAAAVAPADDAIKSFVNLITQPDAALEHSPMFTSIADTLHQKSHTLPPRQFQNELIGAVQPLLEGNEKRATYIVESFVGYREALHSDELKAYPKVRAKRMEIYRNSLYSQFKDLAENSPTKFSADALEKARVQLTRLLSKNTGDRTSQLDDAFVKEVKNLVNSVSSNPQGKLVRFNRGQINEQLKNTNGEGVPMAQLVDGLTLRKLLMAHANHMAHHERPHHFHATVVPGVSV